MSAGPARNQYANVLGFQGNRQQRVASDFTKLLATAALRTPEILGRQSLAGKSRLFPEAAFHAAFGKSVAMQDVRVFGRQDQPRLARVHIIAAGRERHGVGDDTQQVA